MVHTAYLALGSNLGDRAAMLAAARERLGQLPGTHVPAMSSIHETAPVGGPPRQRPYLNAALKLQTKLTPEQLLAECLTIERDLGRVRSIRNAPRTIDIDILLYDDLVLDTPDLIVPHPRMQERDFVLRPLAEIAAETVHPVLGLSVTQVLANLQGKTPETGPLGPEKLPPY